MNEAVSPRTLFTTLSIVIALSLGAPLVSYAAEAERASSGYLEEIIVTGTKRAASQQDTPIAISTITARDIEKTFGNDIRAVGDLSPNVNLTNQTGFNAVAGGIRGTGTISILTTQDPSVGILIDEFALNHVQTQLVELFDLEQVEVYRGPQGTLFGKNSTGGTIAITSKRPDLDEYGATVKVGFGGYDGGSDNKKIQLGLDAPLIEGKLGFRFAGSFSQEDGYYTNDKDTATFPNSPLYQLLGVTPDLLPPELSQLTVGGGERLGGKEVFAAKAKLLWQPNDRYEAYFIWEIVDDNSDSPPGINETPGDEGFLLELLGFPGFSAAGETNPFSTGVTQQGNGINIRDGHRVNVNGYYLQQSLSFDNFTLKSVTGFRNQRETLPSTYTGEAFLSLFDATRNLERDQFQQELRVVTEFDGPFNFVVGGIYISDDLDFLAYSTQGLLSVLPLPIAKNDFSIPFFDDRGFLNLDLRNITGDPGGGFVKQERDSIAGYFDASYDVNEKLRLTAGVRITEDKKHLNKPLGAGVCSALTDPRDVIPTDPNLPVDLATNTNCTDIRSSTVSRAGITGAQIDQHELPRGNEAYGQILDVTQKWSEVTWRFVADYQFNDKQMVYGSIATGFLSGGFSETCGSETTCLPYNPETNTNYEVGYKGDLLDNRLRLNVAAFYTKFEDLQRNQVFRFTNIDGSPGQETITLNAGKSNAKGVEIEATWLVSDSLQVKGTFGWLDAEYDEFEFEGLDLTGLSVPFASEFQIGAEVSYTHDLANGAAINVTTNVHYQDEAEMSPFDETAASTLGVARHPTFTQMEKRTLLNAHVTYSSPGERYYVTAFGRNLLNETYRVSANSVGSLWNFTMYGAPLQWGVEFGMNFN